MVQRIGGGRRKTRKKYRKNIRKKGKISIARYFQKFNIGDKVNLSAESAIQEGMYFRRFHGRVGEVKGKQGSCYKIQIRDGKKEKILIVHPIHLKRI